MCGIVGYVGRRDACPILIKGLHRLEYRGYDSAGVALVNPDGRLNVFKCKGKVSDLEHFLDGKDLGGNIGIAHTRWATHGVPNDANAHPHYSESENIALIHNGPSTTGRSPLVTSSWVYNLIKTYIIIHSM